MLSEIRNEITSSALPLIQKSQKIENPLIICIKSYGDYRYINAADICLFSG